MKKTHFTLLFIFSIFTQLFSQQVLISPMKNQANIDFLNSETSKMSLYMMQDATKIPIGNIQTQIKKETEKTYIITTVNMKQSTNKWIDTTVVATQTLKPIYHSSFNQQRAMVLKFGEHITGYYLDKSTNVKTEVSEKITTSFFDSNFYPQLIRLLPLKNEYSGTISIFDFNPKSKIGVITATIKNTQETTIDVHGIEKQVWKVETTDDISNNTTVSTYYIEKSTRKILKQEIDFGSRKMLMELEE
ncbi:hypothetical protein [Kordia sp.]|uniref:DUF3108 domain-containing protein n=1 Tax=Kordia sp. TaxID=1965332 RepID=UPI003B5B6C1A